MYQYQDQKEMRRALNGKMIVMLVGIMLVMTALTSSLSYGIRCWWQEWRTRGMKMFWRH